MNTSVLENITFQKRIALATVIIAFLAIIVSFLAYFSDKDESKTYQLQLLEKQIQKQESLHKYIDSLENRLFEKVSQDSLLKCR